MTSDPIRSADFDARLRTVHQASLQALPAPTLARLRAARRQASQTRTAPFLRRGWLLAAVPALLGAALGVHLLLRPAPSVPITTASVVAGTTAVAPTPTGASASTDSDQAASATAMLDENPDLYLWLGSDTSLAME
ncbi:hypothetical protein [Xanthomonas sp. D-109]|uniref:hypothetical protein n=1 Tax=Xanthomonas sp. D-109 TaxID=2821274 RepID=UPI001ADBB95C|nr:hypothetical protein [Xanthomonas sp. D-109]MBO9883630.1 hypothetical protein [Xanthomonas sp. D-109]